MYEILRFRLRFVEDIGKFIGELSNAILNLFHLFIFAMSEDKMRF